MDGSVELTATALWSTIVAWVVDEKKPKEGAGVLRVLLSIGIGKRTLPDEDFFACMQDEGKGKRIDGRTTGRVYM